MAYENYVIRIFENAMFKDDRSVMSNEEYDTVYTEFIDTAKMYEEEEFQQVSYISYLHGRINSIKIGIRLQREFINNFDIPYIPAFQMFKNNGVSIYWKGDKENFLSALERIEKGQKKYTSEVENCIKNLMDFRLKKQQGDNPVKIKRETWIKNINTLGKIGYKIDKDKTSVEELALMIVQQKEENKK